MDATNQNTSESDSNVKTLDSKIQNILKKSRVDGIFHSHVSLIRPQGKFHFNREVLEKFWNNYCNYVQYNPVVGIAEKPQQYLPVLADIDLRMQDNKDFSGDSLYTDQQLKTVIETYQSVLRQIVQDCTEEDLTCVVLEKDMRMETKNDTTYYKHGFHLHFPYLFLNKVDQEVHLIPRVQNVIRDAKLFANINVEDSGNVIDKVCCKVPWLLYGSRKSEQSQPYIVTRVYNSELKELTLEKAFKNYRLYDHQDQSIDIKGKVDKYLPRILSIIPYGRPTKEVKRGLISPLKEKIKKKERKSSTVQHRLSPEQAIIQARELLPMVGSFRAEDYNDWMRIGWLLYNITEGSTEGLDLWCDFSSRCEDKYDESRCIQEWERMVKKDLTIGTLHYYAKHDNPLEYKKYVETRVKTNILGCIENASHNDIAKQLYEEYGRDFVCSSFANRTWYQFIGHTWQQIEEGVFLREKISGRISDRYTEISKELMDQVNKTQDKALVAMLNGKMKMVNKVVINLKNANYKNSVMREAAEVFYDPEFKSRLDSNSRIVAFKNGVYDLTQNKFREGQPEDYLSRHMPINYIEYTETDDKVQSVYTFLEQVFPDKSVRKYFMDISSDVFHGGNNEKIAVFWTGEGNNGKSKTQEFFELMLGPLAVKLNTNVITGKKPSSGSAFADLARTGGGVRWAVLEEPDNDEVINIGILKHLTGGDSLFARDLFEKGKDTKEIKPMFKLTVICNKLPRLKNPDKATWNRIRVIPFESTFCPSDDPAPESFEEQLRTKRFPMDKKFSEKIPQLVEAFAWVLLQHRQKVGMRVEPEKVRIATEIYRKQNDIYRQFMDEYIIEDEKSSVSLTQVYGWFKDWFKDSLPGTTVPVKNEVEEYFCRVWGYPDVGKRWKGYRQRVLNDHLKTGEKMVIPDDQLVDYSTNPKSSLPKL